MHLTMKDILTFWEEAFKLPSKLPVTSAVLHSLQLISDQDLNLVVFWKKNVPSIWESFEYA